MRTTGLAAAAGSSALLLCLLATPSSAQDRSRQQAPVIRVYSQDGGGVVSSYVTPAVEVSEDAYVFAVMMDLDGHIQVLHPEFPGISVRVRSHKQLRLPNFFAGFNEPMQGSQYYTRYGQVSYDRYDSPANDTRGTVIALVSRAPFNLEAIEADGDWNISAIRRLIEHRTPASAAQSLAQYLGARGEPIGRDYMRFAGQRQSQYAYNDLAYCGNSGFGYGLQGALYRAGAFTRATQLRSVGLRPFVIGYDACGLPIVVFAPFTQGGGLRVPPRPRHPGDTTVFPKSPFFPNRIPRNPTNGEVAPMPAPAAEGIFPLRQRAQPPQKREPTITTPEGIRADPREIPDRFLRQPGNSPIQERERKPVEPTAPSRAEPATGVQPVYRPEPRVIVPAEPARMPERIREPAPAPAPAPVVRERPVESPPPPPRVHVEPQSKPEPAPVPPPRR